MNDEFPRVKHKVIDSHLHIYDWKNENGEDFFHCFEQYRSNMGLAGLNIAALPSGYGNDVTSNIMCAIYKLINRDTYAHAGLLYDKYPMRECLPDEAINNITHLNFERRVGAVPKPINKEALRSYYAKYKHLMIEEDIKKVESVFAKFL